MIEKFPFMLRFSKHSESFSTAWNIELFERVRTTRERVSIFWIPARN